MKSRLRLSSCDHYLVSRVQACVTGANAHEIHAILGNYFELCLLVEKDASLVDRLHTVESKLRAFCQAAGRPSETVLDRCIAED